MGRAAALIAAVLTLLTATLPLARAQVPAQVPAQEERELSREAGEANIRGARLRLSGDYTEARREFDRVIRLAPDSRIGWYNRGLVSRDVGDCHSAIDDLTQALARAPDFFGALYHRGNCRQALGDFRGAIADYGRAIELPGRLDGRFLAHFARGDAQRRLGELEAALADYTRVAGLRTDTAVLRSRAWVYLYLGRWQAARDDAVRFLDGGEGKEAGSAYATLVGFIALSRNGERERAATFLSQWAGRLDAVAWPAPVLRHFGGTLGEREMIAAATTDGERLEAQTYAGMARLLAGDRAEGVNRLKAVLEQGNPRYWEYDLAYYELRRLGEASGPPARRTR